MEIDSDPLLLEGIKRSIASKDINAPFTPRTIALEAKLHCPPPGAAATKAIDAKLGTDVGAVVLGYLTPLDYQSNPLYYANHYRHWSHAEVGDIVMPIQIVHEELYVIVEKKYEKCQTHNYWAQYISTNYSTPCNKW